MSHARLALHGLACERGGRRLFDGLELTLTAGGAAIARGPNGAGKSSLLRIIAGLLAPAAGRIEREGAIAWMGEAAALDADRPLIEALAFWARIDEQSGAASAEALETMGLANLAEVPVRMLSTGQRRRAALARVIGGAAPIWLLDEPGNGFDAAALGALEQAIAAHRANGGIVVAATHLPLALANAAIVTLGKPA